MKIDEQWVETFTIFFIAIGFIVSVLLTSSLWSYLSIILAGLLAGRIYYLKKFKEPILPFVIIILGFLLGYWAGSFWTNRVLTLLFFALAFVVSYYLHLKKIVVIFKSKNFIK